MQSARPEVSPNATLVDQPRNPSSSIQYGQPVNDRPASGGALHDSRPGVSLAVSDDLDSASVSSGDTQRGRPFNAGRINSRNDSSQSSSPGSRIDEYEKAQVSHRKRSKGLIFQVIPSPSDKTQIVSIESFPNGAARCFHSSAISNTMQRS